MTSPDKPESETPEKWESALQQRSQPCACRFEWREIPDFSGLPPKQVDECGFHAEQRRELERRLRAATQPVGDAEVSAMVLELHQCAANKRARGSIGKEQDTHEDRAASLLERLAREKAAAEKDAAAVRELMNVYNLGGWTDAVGPMKRALAAEQRADALQVELASANRECEVRNERELGYLARAQSAEAERDAMSLQLSTEEDWAKRACAAEAELDALRREKGK